MVVLRVCEAGSSETAEQEVPDELALRSSIIKHALSAASEGSRTTMVLPQGSWQQYVCAWLKTALPCASSSTAQRWTTADLVHGLKVR